MDPYPSPHTDAWFTALAAINPEQAERTKLMVGRAGRLDVCSLCGDQPANAYQILDAHLPTEALATLRLCTDCHTIQRVQCGEDFVRMSETEEGVCS